MKGYDTGDTICALATPEGVGAIGVVRLSGDRALQIADSVFSGKKLSDQKANTAHFGKIEVESRTVDEVVVTIFRGPYSYTGEDIVEISGHGSPLIQSEILKLLTEKGARLAREGEFTFRAFLNGKLDLSQAEAVADLIAAESSASKQLALNQLRGGYSSKLKELRDQLMDFASLLELELDFSEEDVDFADREKFKNLISELRRHLELMMKSFEYGNAIRKGIPVAIIGEPNVGKSTLLNQILHEERAIVSDIPGTTRDVIEDIVSIGGIMFRFIDTAGLRETEDKIEGMGIERARSKAAGARIVLHILDARKGNSDESGFQSKNGQLVFRIMNKVDMLEREESVLPSKNENTLWISAKEGRGVPELLDKILATINQHKVEGSGVVVSNQRHYDALKSCDESMERVQEGMESGLSSELIAMDVRQALHFLGEITGEVTSDDLLGNIFSRFCIGK